MTDRLLTEYECYEEFFRICHDEKSTTQEKSAAYWIWQATLGYYQKECKIVGLGS